jgi:hypothetical protein
MRPGEVFAGAISFACGPQNGPIRHLSLEPSHDPAHPVVQCKIGAAEGKFSFLALMIDT